jgi:hypothetical protein
MSCFRVDDNPDLCMTKSCRNKELSFLFTKREESQSGKKNLLIPIALIAILFISLGFYIFNRQKGTSIMILVSAQQILSGRNLILDDRKMVLPQSL